MRKSFLELQYLEEQKLNEELNKAGNAKKYYKLLSIFKSLAITFFILNLVIIIVAGVYEFMVININNLFINFLIITFAILSMALLLISVFYKNKTLEILQRYYKEQTNI